MTSGQPSTQSLNRLPYAGFGWRSAAAVVAKHLPGQLVGTEKRDALFSFAERLPISWYWGMFETRLAPEESRVDLLGALVQGSDTREQIVETFKNFKHSALHSAESTLAAWARDDGTLFARSPNFWFEWDQDRPDTPALNWLCLAPEFFDRSARALSTEEIVRLTDQFLSSTPSLEVRSAKRTLQRLVSSLPQGGKLMSFSSLKPRGRNVCRVFARLPLGRTKAWLETIGWPGDYPRLDEVLPLFEVEGEQQWCQVEFDETVGPYLALELAQTERGFPNRSAREKWLAHVVDRGWASAEKAQAVLDWHGASPGGLPGQSEVKLLRSFHLKLALVPGNDPEAKAYLGFYFRKPREASAA